MRDVPANLRPPRPSQKVVALRSFSRSGIFFCLRLDSRSSDSRLMSVSPPKSTKPLSGRDSGSTAGFNASNQRATFEFGLNCKEAEKKAKFLSVPMGFQEDEYNRYTEKRIGKVSVANIMDF